MRPGSTPTRRSPCTSWASSMPTPPPHIERADTHYRQALALASELGMRPLQAHYHLGLGTLYAMMGRRAEAQTALSTAIGLYRSMDMTFWLPEAEVALTEVEGRP